jgi:hypothetical protein
LTIAGSLAAYMLNHSDECLLKGKDGNPVPRPVYGFDGGAGSCGVEKWLQGVQEMIDKGGIQGIFLDGFQVTPNNITFI